MFLTKHLKDNNETYLSHMLFASKVALYLSVSSICYSVHAMLPFVSVPERFTLESIVNQCVKWHNYTVIRAMEKDKK